LPLSWLQLRNTLVLFEETRIEPEGVHVSLSSFGAQTIAWQIA
jgi:hypothetical protein